MSEISTLFQAIRINDLEAIKSIMRDMPALLEYEYYTPKGPPLNYSIEHGTPESTRLLIETGADVEAVGLASRTPLICAAIKNRSAHMQLLIDAGANVHGVDEGGWTAIMYAAWYGAADCIRTLYLAGVELDFWCIDSESDDQLCPLHLAADGGYLECVELLLELGLDVNSNRNGYTPLMAMSSISVISSPDSEDCTELLLARGADATICNSRGCSVLHYASADHVDMLVRAGADINKKNNEGSTPLQWAVNDSSNERIHALMKAGADPTGCEENNIVKNCFQERRIAELEAKVAELEDMILELRMSPYPGDLYVASKASFYRKVHAES